MPRRFHSRLQHFEQHAQDEATSGQSTQIHLGNAENVSCRHPNSEPISSKRKKVDVRKCVSSGSASRSFLWDNTPRANSRRSISAEYIIRRRRWLERWECYRQVDHALVRYGSKKK